MVQKQDCCEEHPPLKNLGHPAYAAVPDAKPGATYTCPMHPEIRQTGPGNCPKCGMALEPAEVSLEESEMTPELVDFTRRLKVSLVLTVPLLFIAMTEMFHGRGLNWLQLLLATPVVLWGGRPFFERGWASVRTWNLNMFTLISLGTGAAYLYSVIATLAPGLFPATLQDHGEVGVYFEASAVIVCLVLLGQVLELRARRQTSSAIKALLRLAPNTARIVRADGREEDIDVRQVHPGDQIRIRPGEWVPVDGIVISGKSSVDESMITGESAPVLKEEGAPLSAGTTNETGSLLMKATNVGEKTLLAQIVRLVMESQRSRAPIQSLADKVSAWFVPAVVLVSILTGIAWTLWGPEPTLLHALANSVAVLIVACPCALGLATPMSVMVGTGRGAVAGVLVRNAEALERLEKIDTLLLDKTGTLTEGRPKLVRTNIVGEYREEEVFRIAAALEKGSEHPLAVSILQRAREMGIQNLPETKLFRSISGMGIMGDVEGKSVLLGNAALLKREGIEIAAMESDAQALRESGGTVLFMTIDRSPAALFSVADPIKASTPEALRVLRSEGFRIAMLTGDHAQTAHAVAEKLGISEVYAEVLPGQKSDVVKRLQLEGRKVAVAGDGINDAPALAQADVGIAMGSGTDIAMQSAGITLVKGDLRGILRAIHLSRATLSNIRQNLFFAFIYNVLSVPIAAGILYPFFGILLSPMIASAAMSLSSVSVIGNALRLRKLSLT